MRNQLVAILILAILATMVLTSTVTNVNARSGNNGQCRKLQDMLPPELRDYPGCHDTFTGPGHNYPPPLP
jgi:hypothetical protein